MMTPEAAVVGIVEINKTHWRIHHTYEGNYVGVCDELGITMEGRTEGDLFENIIHSLALLKEDQQNP